MANIDRRQSRRERRRARREANRSVNIGQGIGENLAPELFQPEGLGRLDFADYDQYLAPSLAEAGAQRGETRGAYDDLLGLRRDKLGGLDASENQALKASLFRDIDRQRSGALRDVQRGQAKGLGAGQAFGQRRALGRDYADAASNANQDLILKNVGIKQQALDSLEGTTGAKMSAMDAANANMAALRGQQLTTRSGVDQFNLGQLQTEIGGRLGAVSAGAGIYKDERDRIEAARKEKELLEYMRQRDENKFNQIQSIL